ncbi:glycoside hydrolase family 5 protein [Candidatus Bathyarchaeota archaeon]|nr:glycoside hydrolase family 5 protein [Candidatus Bathyarchaeota archaeon]
MRHSVELLLCFFLLLSVSPLTQNLAVAERSSTVVIASSGVLESDTPVAVSALHVEGNKIKDVNGNIVYLRGANYFHYSGYASSVWLRRDGSVLWGGDWSLTREAIIENFDEMAKYHFNSFRIHTCAQHWKERTDYISHMQEIASLAMERGIYIIIDIYDITDAPLNTQGLPYPPYSDANLVIPNEQAFVDLWGLIAEAMKNSPNVIFELYNEPHGDLLQVYLDTCQKCITRIRTITNHCIMVMWGWQVTIGDVMSNYAYDSRISGTNIIISAHTYPDGAYILFPYQGGTPVNSHDDLVLFCERSKITEVASQKPVVITEVGGFHGDAWSMTWFSNLLDVYNELGVGYNVWVWNPYPHEEGCLTGGANFALNDKGTILTQKTLQMP